MKILKVLGFVVLGLVVLLVGLRCAFNKPRPTGETGPAADEMARTIEKMVDREAWERTGAVRWTFAGRRSHLWDRQRKLVRERVGDEEIFLNLETMTGKAFRAGKPVADPEAADLVKRTYAHWANDSFWLNPLVKLFDDGVQRSVVTDESGQKKLMVHYTQGGVTPGDAYVWGVGPDGMPTSVQMWVSIIPVGGVEATWDGWMTLPTGAKVATKHLFLTREMLMTDVAGAATLAELEPGADPFAVLVGPPAQ
jgi:hypothetical protein